MLRQSDGDQSNPDLVSQVGNEIKVTLDRWSVGQLGVSDLLLAGAVLVAGCCLAWLASRVSKRIARRHEGAVRVAIATAGLLLGGGLVLLAIAVALEVLGFSLGPILVLILVSVAALLFLRPMVTNLTNGVLLQLRGALAVGDLVRTSGVLGTVGEINARTVVFDTTDGRQIHIPNTDVLNGLIENHSASGRRRSTVEFAVEASIDVRRVLAAAEAAVEAADGVLDEPEPVVRLRRIAGRFVVVGIDVWHGPEPADQRSVVSSVLLAITESCAEQDISLVGPESLAVVRCTHGDEGASSSR